MATIKQIKVGSTNYDLDALHLLDNGGTGHSYEDIVALINKGLQIVIDSKSSSKDEPATPASTATMGKLYLVQLSGQTASGTYTEFITLESGTSPKTYSWEKIGTTAADLSQYAKKTEAAKPGTYTSTGPSTDATSSAGGQTATGAATVTYKKSATATGSAGGISGNTGDGGAISITYTPEGSISGTQTISAHSHTVNASAETVSISTSAATKKGVKVTTSAASTASVGISGGSITGATPVTVVTGVTAAGLSSATTSSDDAIAYVESISGSAPSLGGTKTFNTDAIKDVTLSASTTSDDGPEYIESVELPTMTTISFTKNTLQSLTTKNYGFSASTSDVMRAPTVTNGVLSWSTSSASTQDALSAGAQASLTGGVFTDGSKVTKYMKKTTTAATSKTVSISGGSYTATTKYVKATGGVASGTTSVVPSYTHTPATLTGTTTFVTSAIKSASLAEDTATTPAFAFNTDAIKSASSSQAFVKSATLATNGGATINFSNAEFDGTTATLTQAAHKHSVSATAHTHSITLSDATITGTAAVAVSAHTHSLSGHTHNVVVPAIA